MVVVQAARHLFLTGGDGNLAIILGTYSPNIQCSGAIRGWPSCSDIMNGMDVTSTNVKFGPHSDPSAQVTLPDTLSSSELLSLPIH